MQSHSYYETICCCGLRTEHREQDAWICRNCGRKSIIDFSIGYSERELVEILNGLDVQRDSLVKAIENRRQKAAA